jgi:uncharacterized membrane protein YgdD (TMEM256/DUF423 family)
MFLVAAAVSGLVAVGLGAFGAHALRSRFAQLEDGAKRLEWWTTSAHYHLTHSVVLAVVGLLLLHRATTVGRVSGYCLLVGMLLFSGSLYTMALTGIRALGAVTPFGGLALLAGWAALAVAAFKLGA